MIKKLLALVLLVVGAGAVYWLSNDLGHPEHSPLTACKSNCKNLASVLDLYAQDNHGNYPPTLAKLLEGGNYLKVLPTCPAAGHLTYTDYQVSQKPANFSFTCVGNNHAKQYQGFSTSSDNFPQYNGTEGLLDHP